jgi:periplasmic protein TonB
MRNETALASAFGPHDRGQKEALATTSAPHQAPEKRGLFINGMLEIPSSTFTRRRPLQVAASLAIHAAVIAALIVVPGYFVTKVVEQPPKEVTLVFTPPVPAPPPPAAARAAAPKSVPTPTPNFRRTQPLEAPRMIPKSVATTAQAAPVTAPDLGIPDGVEGGSPDGVLGGIIGGTGSGPAAPPTTAVVRVGGDVKRPELLQRVEPVYPVVAKISHLQGTVEINAVIDPQGNVVQEHAVDGPAVLVPAALDAVRQWKYAPTYLDGKPVALNMEVSVSFRLNS